MTGAVVVGVSPRTGSPAALQWAAGEAALRSAPLRAVLAWRPPSPPPAPGGRPLSAGSSPSAAESANQAAEHLREFVTAALGADAEVDYQVVRGGVVNALLTAAGGADLLVIGEPQQGRLASARVARLVAPQVVVKAPCPVVVMPASAATPR